MKCSQRDKDILKSLAAQIAEAAADPVNEERRRVWRMLNNLTPERPAVYAYQLPWKEINLEDELDLQCENKFAANIENGFRKKLYQWKHMPVDMIIEDTFYSPMSLNVTSMLETEEELLNLHEQSSVVSHRYEPQIKTEKDIGKIKIPEVIYNREESDSIYGFCKDCFDGILKVRRGGVTQFRMAIWDRIVTWTGVQEILLDLVTRPDYVHAVCKRTTDAFNALLAQYQDIGLIADTNNHTIISDGGLGYTNDLPGNFEAGTGRLWGGCAAQIFGDVSPEMHEEFALRYEKPYLERFGLSYYGCCEPLHKKIGILKKNISNLRKISCSPWANVESMAEQCGKDYVISIKPNPAILAEDVFDLKRAEKYLRERIAPVKGCAVEIILKDVSTVRNDPQRLWQWCKMAVDIAHGHSN